MQSFAIAAATYSKPIIGLARTKLLKEELIEK
jgi:hypothetical protein